MPAAAAEPFASAEDLKRRAVALQQEGDVDGAREALQAARALEFADTSPSDLTDPVRLKQLAVYLKKKGDIAAAKEALIRAKHLEKEAVAAPAPAARTEEEEDLREKDVCASSSAVETKEEESAAERDASAVAEVPIKEEGGDAAAEDESWNEEEPVDDEALNALLGEGPVTYSEEEMLDEEMITMFRLGGMSVPTNDEYQAKVLSSKRKALALKNAGDIAAAKEELTRAKQFEKVRIALSHMDEGLGLRIHDDKDGWLEELNQEDSAAVGEILTNGKTTCANSVQLDVNDIEGMSPQELLDAADMGMDLPSADDVLAKAEEKKTLALTYKNEGNIDAAKIALLDYKKMQATAAKMQSIRQRQGQPDDGGQISMEALESLLDDEPKATVSPKQQEQPIKAPARPPLSAEELKQKAVQLRNENNLKEATAVFKLYKEALAKEAEGAEKKRCQEIVDSLKAEISLAEQQRRLFTFYARFVDAQSGAEQLTKWNKYATQCTHAVRLVEKQGSEAVIITRNAIKSAALLRMDEEKLVDYIDGAADASDGRLEVAVLDVRNVHENKTFRKLLSENNKEGIDPPPSTPHTLRVEVTIQIPPTEEERDKPVELLFESPPCTELGQEYQFGTSQYVDVPRGDSKFAETVRRRMERRKLQISVHHVRQQEEEKKKGWFGGSTSNPSSSSSEQSSPPTHLLGKVVLELKELLTRNCMAGDFALTTAKKDVGGTLGLVVRTGVPFDAVAQQRETDKIDTTLTPHAFLSFSLPKDNNAR